MGWQDRSYYRDSASPRNPLMWLLNGSVPLFTVFGIRVRMHASLLAVFVLQLILCETSWAMPRGFVNAITFDILLFGIILLHEFGHCFAARRVGGDASDIMMWLLGGLAYADAPNRPWPQLVTAVGGPLVNVFICLITWGGMFGIVRLISHDQFTLNPLDVGGLYYYFAWAFDISLALLIFNLLPLFPLDGGRILQCLLWFKLKFYRATLITCVVGMIGSVLMVAYGLARFNSWYGILLIVIGLNCFWICFQMRAQLKAAGPWEFEDDGIDYSAAMWKPERPTRKRKLFSRRAKRRLRKQAEAEESEQLRIDAILAKVSAHGMANLTWGERRALRKATERQRRREVEVSGE